MKNLANCKPSEFLRQTNRIKKSVEKWLTVTDIMNIRKNMPEFDKAPDEATIDEKGEIVKQNREKYHQQAKKNLSRMLDAILEEHPEETLELLALLCFVEPEDVDNHQMDEYLQAITDMISNQAVIGFFTSLEQLGLTSTSTVSAV